MSAPRRRGVRPARPARRGRRSVTSSSTSPSRRSTRPSALAAQHRRPRRADGRALPRRPAPGRSARPARRRRRARRRPKAAMVRARSCTTPNGASGAAASRSWETSPSGTDRARPSGRGRRPAAPGPRWRRRRDRRRGRCPARGGYPCAGRRRVHRCPCQASRPESALPTTATSPPGAGQGLAERARIGVVEVALVGGDDLVDRDLHHVAGRATAGAALVLVAGGSGPYGSSGANASAPSRSSTAARLPLPIVR